jgi:hypothetical protein
MKQLLPISKLSPNYLCVFSRKQPSINRFIKEKVRYLYNTLQSRILIVYGRDSTCLCMSIYSFVEVTVSRKSSSNQVFQKILRQAS